MDQNTHLRGTLSGPYLFGLWGKHSKLNHPWGALMLTHSPISLCVATRGAELQGKRSQGGPSLMPESSRSMGVQKRTMAENGEPTSINVPPPDLTAAPEG